MKKEDIDKVIDAWKNHLLVGPLEGYQLEISDDVPEAFAAVALYLDSKTVRASGEVEEFYEGYRQAAVDVLNLIGGNRGRQAGRTEKAYMGLSWRAMVLDGVINYLHPNET